MEYAEYKEKYQKAKDSVSQCLTKLKEIQLVSDKVYDLKSTVSSFNQLDPKLTDLKTELERIETDGKAEMQKMETFLNSYKG